MNSDNLDWIKIKYNIAYVEQELPKWFGSLKDNLHYEASFYNTYGNQNRQEVDFIIHRLGLTEHVNKRWHQLSGGYKLRFSLAKAFIRKPKLLVLDEPLANLDTKAKNTVLNDLRDLANSGKHPLSILISSQDLHEIEFISDKILFIKDGKPVFYGLKDDLGSERKYNYFEIQTKLKKEDLIRILDNLKIVDVIHESMYVQIVTPLEITSEIVVKELLKNDLPITYFRDISNSTKRLFI